jgi:hypothetical protein
MVGADHSSVTARVGLSVPVTGVEWESLAWTATRNA